MSGFRKEKKQYSRDELIVNHNDACIYGRDLALLEDSRAWLNDACLHYQMVCLQERYGDRCLFFDPAVAFCLVHQLEDADEYQQFAKSYDLSKQCIFIPINDTLADGYYSRQQPGLGSHWSLLMIVGVEPEYWHWDSIPGSSNGQAALAVARQWNHVLEYRQQQRDNNPPIVGNDPTIVSASTPRQMNGYDCGLHVLWAAQVLAECDGHENGERTLQVQYSHSIFGNLRRQIAQDIRERVTEM